MMEKTDADGLGAAMLDWDDRFPVGDAGSRWTSTNRYVIHGTCKWVDDHLSREPIVVFVAEIVISPADHPDGLLSKLVRYGLDQCTGFSCREAGYAELNHLLIRFIFLDQHLALGLVCDGDVRDLLALDMSIDGVITPLMYFMLAIGVDIIPEQLMRREMLVLGKRHSSECQDTDRGNGGAEETASAIHGVLLSSSRWHCPHQSSSARAFIADEGAASWN